MRRRHEQRRREADDAPPPVLPRVCCHCPHYTRESAPRRPGDATCCACGAQNPALAPES